MQRLGGMACSGRPVSRCMHPAKAYTHVKVLFQAAWMPSMQVHIGAYNRTQGSGIDLRTALVTRPHPSFGWVQFAGMAQNCRSSRSGFGLLRRDGSARDGIAHLIFRTALQQGWGTTA